jgi:hypothetical protein
LTAAKYGRPKAVVEKDIFARMATRAVVKPAFGGAGQLPSSGFGAQSVPGGGFGAPAGAYGQAPGGFGSQPSMAAGPRPAGPPLSSGAGGSFLDDWLAKRQQPAASTRPMAPMSASGPSPAPYGSSAPAPINSSFGSQPANMNPFPGSSSNVAQSVPAMDGPSVFGSPPSSMSPAFGSPSSISSPPTFSTLASPAVTVSSSTTHDPAAEPAESIPLAEKPADDSMPAIIKHGEPLRMEDEPKPDEDRHEEDDIDKPAGVPMKPPSESGEAGASLPPVQATPQKPSEAAVADDTIVIDGEGNLQLRGSGTDS